MHTWQQGPVPSTLDNKQRSCILCMLHRTTNSVDLPSLPSFRVFSRPIVQTTWRAAAYEPKRALLDNSSLLVRTPPQRMRGCTANCVLVPCVGLAQGAPVS